MRTTLTIEDDVAVQLERIRQTRKASLKAVVNDALRQGLRQMQDAPRRTNRFETRTVDLGDCLIGNVDDVSEALAIAEGERFK